MKVLIDTNIVLDLILEREPFVEAAIALFEQIEQGNICKTEGREVALAAINRLLTGLQFCAVDRQTVEIALSLDLTDFEDSVQLACATFNQLDAIVTRDGQDFRGSNLPIYSPTELLNQL